MRHAVQFDGKVQIGLRGGRMKNKKTKQKMVKVAWFLLGVITALIPVLYITITTPEETPSCVVIEDYLKNVSKGTVSLKFLLEKATDIKEVSEFCKSKGFDRGFASSPTQIFCDSDEGRYKYFSIMKDFAEYIYKKYEAKEK